ncbi:tyrosine-type recombinase/integrase [uncultured Akkermansia sp.]|uniref:tyrosine-type recombinase/integrase n=1 Tax=Akkermansia sp. TaxID=1872421 RepID=UPI0025FD07E9|nr:tyrosine-type recombinase/integrase [uncultured Akkermansia sp.]
MAGLIERNKKWVAVMRTPDGREIRRSTKIPVLPVSLKPKESLQKAASQNKTHARLLADELEKLLRGESPDYKLVESLLGSQGLRFFAEQSGTVSTQMRPYLESWLKSRANRIGAIERDGKAVKQFLAFLGKQDGMELTRVTTYHARAFMEKELERVASGTVKRYLTSLSCAFNRAVEKKLIFSNPFKGILPSTLEQKDKQERKAFTMDEVKQLLKIMPDEWPDMIRVCLYTGGQRLGDVAKLTWAQIDLEDGRLRMTTQKSKLSMNKPIIKPLERVLQRRKEVSISKYVFPIAAMKHSQGGGKSSKLSLEFTNLLEEHGFISKSKKQKGDRRELAEKSFHSLRATAVTVLRLAGVPADLCRFIVGHDSEEIEKVYFRPQDEEVNKAVGFLAQGLEEDL